MLLIQVLTTLGDVFFTYFFYKENRRLGRVHSHLLRHHSLEYKCFIVGNTAAVVVFFINFLA